jgi:hypothetical protein
MPTLGGTISLPFGTALQPAANAATIRQINQAESFFSRLRRAKIGTHHHVAGPYLAAYASEMAWRENNRRISNGEQYLMATDAALQHPVSRQWKGYWQS